MQNATNLMSVTFVAKIVMGPLLSVSVVQVYTMRLVLQYVY